MTLYIFRGLPGCGKSTKAREMQRDIGGRVVERDEVRYMLYGRYTDCDENLVTNVQHALIEEGLRMGENVFVSDMNLRNQYVQALYSIAWRHNTDVSVVDMTNVPVEECLTRNLFEERIIRNKAVPQHVITNNYQRFIKGKPYPLPFQFTGAKLPTKRYEKYVRDETKPAAIIVDVDGTVARMVERGPFDEHLVMTDEKIDGVINMVQVAFYQGIEIIFMSGRTDGCYEDTRRWLNLALPWLDNDFELIMRRTVEDRGRPDDDVKYDLFKSRVEADYNVWYVLDDRNKVVKMWREIGLTCAQVAEGDF